MTTYQWLCVLGIPTLSGIIVSALVVLFKRKRSQSQATRLGIKALLRSQMISEYRTHYEERGYASIFVKDNFQNIWEQYHAIKGPNGVMDDIHDKFMRLPTEPPENEKEE